MIIEMLKSAKEMAKRFDISVQEAIDRKVKAYVKYAKNDTEAVAWGFRGEDAKALYNGETNGMKAQEELITIWNELPAQEKMALGDHYITHQTNLKTWDKSFEDLSPLKQKRVLQSIEEFSKVKNHAIIGSGI